MSKWWEEPHIPVEGLRFDYHPAHTHRGHDYPEHITITADWDEHSDVTFELTWEQWTQTCVAMVQHQAYGKPFEMPTTPAEEQT